MEHEYEDGFCDHAESVGPVFVGLGTTEDGTPIARIMRIRKGQFEPDFLLSDGRWWSPHERCAGTCYALPYGDVTTSHRTAPMHDACIALNGVRQ